MIRLIKYTKPYLLWILLAIVLLFAQANFDLALPDYLSRIINIGLQQSGIENAVPKAIRHSQLERVTTFLSADEKTLVLNEYTLVQPNTPEAANQVGQYPALKTEPVYILKNIDAAEIDRLNPILARGLLTVATLQQVMADPAKAAQMGSSLGFDLSKLPPGTDLFAMLQRLPPDQLNQISDKINQQYSMMGPSLITQAATVAVKDEYTALGMDVGALQMGVIVRIGSIMLLFALLSGIATISVAFISSRAAAGMARDLRRDMFTKVTSFANSEFDQFSPASLITRTTNDVTQVQMVVMIMIRIVFYAPIMGVGGVIRMLGKDSSMWWLIAVAVMALITLILIIVALSLPPFRRIQKLTDRINLVAREFLSGIMVIRAFNMQPFEEKRFDGVNKELTATNLFVNRIMVIMMPLMMLIMNGLTLAIIWVGAHQVAEANMQVGDMIAIMQYAMQIVMSFLMLSMMIIFLPRAAVSGDRIADVLETEPAIQDPPSARSFPQPFKGIIEFRNVCFRYPGADTDVLKDLNFTALPGQTTALIGTTGSGKSTLINLIPRFYEVTEGSILIDGIDIRDVSQHDLREKIGYIPQKSVLFSGTVESNLRYANEHSSVRNLQSALSIAQASEFIASQADGIAMPIAQGGTNVSGGQKQRLAIARALVKKAPIYIYDDSFSALDFRTDAALRQALKQELGNSTILIVTQRVSTIKNAEQILVIDEGRIVGKGTHDELMTNNLIYKEFAMSQLSMEELS